VIEKENKFVRFHAMQSIITFGGIFIISFVLSFIMPFLMWRLWYLIWIIQLILWVILMVKAYQGEKFKLPVIGDIAEKSAG